MEKKESEQVSVTQSAPTAVVAQPQNGLAIAAMVVGIVAFLSGLVPFWGLAVGVSAVVIGSISLKKTTRKGMSVTGIVLGGIAALVNLIVIILFLVSLAAVGTIVATGIATGIAKSSDSSAEIVNNFKVGDVISFDSKKINVSTPERNWNSGNQFITPDSGNEFIKIQVTIENDSNNEVAYNTFDWKLQDSKGVIKDISSATYGTDGALNSGELAPSGKVSGFLIFEVASGDNNLTLRYEPSFWSDRKIEIKLQ